LAVCPVLASGRHEHGPGLERLADTAVSEEKSFEAQTH
jgi:hypothetical protein